MSAPADPAALTSTPLAGASQGQDVEATINTPLLPSVSQPRLGSRIPLRKIGRISVFVGICVVVLAACCLIFFTSVAIGRSILLRRNKGAHPGNPRSDAQDEYISSILAGGFFPVIMAALFPVFAALDSRWDFDIDSDTLWIFLGFCLLTCGPACVALSSEILRVTHITNMAVIDVVLHYTIGYLALLGGAFFSIPVLSMCGND